MSNYNSVTRLYRENLTPIDVQIYTPQNLFSPQRKITQILWDNPHGHQ